MRIKARIKMATTTRHRSPIRRTSALSRPNHQSECYLHSIRSGDGHKNRSGGWENSWIIMRRAHDCICKTEETRCIQFSSSNPWLCAKEYLGNYLLLISFIKRCSFSLSIQWHPVGTSIQYVIWIDDDEPNEAELTIRKDKNSLENSETMKQI